MAMTMTKKELATLAGYTYRRLYDIDRDLPKDKKLFCEAEDGKYDPALFVQRWVEYNVGQSKGTTMDLDEAKAIHEQVKIEKTRIEVARLQGELVDVNEVRRLWGTVAKTVSQNLLRLPGLLAEQVTGIKAKGAVEEIIDREIRKALEETAATPLPGTGGGEDDEEEETDA